VFDFYSFIFGSLNVNIVAHRDKLKWIKLVLITTLQWYNIIRFDCAYKQMSEYYIISTKTLRKLHIKMAK